MPTSAQQQLQQLLRELFQFDEADLDFGIYRIMNQRREAVETFIDQLPTHIAGSLGRFAHNEQTLIAQELAAKRDEVVRTLGPQAFDDQGNLHGVYQQTPLGLQFEGIRERLAQGNLHVVNEEHIFNDLYTFFARYYEDGDFIARRRYSNTAQYAIPYNGEEVLLHWVNRDQYYVKTGERFSTYQFTVYDHITPPRFLRALSSIV